MNNKIKTIVNGLKNYIDSKTLSSRGDWNQNDKNADNYIKNRPFYTGEPVETVIVEETTFELVDGIGQLTAAQPLEVGQEYIINLDGVQYNSVCKEADLDDMMLPYLGNIVVLGGEDTGEIFFVAPFDSDTALGIMVNSDVVEHTVSIVSNISEIHHIDPKYIKDMYYKEVYDVEPLPQSSLLFGQGEFDDILLPTPLIAGSSYTVNWNGVEYECIAESYGENEAHIENKDVPFFIETWAEGEECYTYMLTPGTGSFNISIYNNTDSVEVLPETSVEIESAITDRVGDLVKMLVEGCEYTVNWNGVEYKCIAKSYNENEVYIGNTALDGDDSSESDEPFCITTFAPDNFSLIIPAEEGTHDVHITGIITEYHTINRSYLPELVGASGTGEKSEIFNDYRNNVASGPYSHAEGRLTTASGLSSHAEGSSTLALGNYSHAEGQNTKASGDASHAEGQSTIASGSGSHAEGSGNIISLFLTGDANSTSYKVSSNNDNIKIGRVLKYNDIYAKITNYDSSTLTITTDKTLSRTNALSNTSVDLVLGIASGQYSHVEGVYTTASGDYSHAEGSNTTASSTSSHAEGSNTTASGNSSHAEGYNTIASSDFSHAEGSYTTASSYNSHAEGYKTTASGNSSHAEGCETHAEGNYSHAEGCETHAEGNYSHAEGKGTIAVYNQNVYGKYNIYEDLYKEEIINVITTNSLRVFLEKNTKFYIASSYTFDAFTGKYSLTNPISITSSDLYNNLSTYKSYYIAIDPTKVNSSFYYYKFKENTKENNAIAKLPLSMTSYNNYNYSCSDVNIQKAVMRSSNEFKYAHIVGNGTSGSNRSNAHTLDWDGNAWFAGEIKIGGTSQDDEEAQTLATTDYVTEQITEAISGSSQADWNQNDETAADYIKNRPFWQESKPTVFINDYLNYDSYEEAFFGSFQDELNLVIGDIYDISINGDKIQQFIPTEENMLYTYESSDGQVYELNFGTGWVDVYIYTSNRTSDQIHVYIASNVTEYHIIDEKYLPKPVGKTFENSNKGEIFNDYDQNIASGYHAHAEGSKTTASGFNSHAEGNGTVASSHESHAEGLNTKASGWASHAEGSNTMASGDASHAEGSHTIAFGESSHAEGSGSINYLYLTGDANSTSYKVDSNNSDIKIGHVLEYNDIYVKITNYDSSTLTITTDKTLSSTALSNTFVKLVFGVASGKYSHIEGQITMASGDASHAEGLRAMASGDASHAEGQVTIASGDASHAEGWRTIAASDEQHVQGRYNIEDVSNTYAHIVGNGTNDSNRSNAHTLDWDGNAWYAGSVEGATVIIKSPNGTRFNITVSDDGALSATKITE